MLMFSGFHGGGRVFLQDGKLAKAAFDSKHTKVIF
jgi:hypothetical protein